MKIDLTTERSYQLAKLALEAERLAEAARKLAEIVSERALTRSDAGLRLAADTAMQSAVLCASRVHTIETLSSFRGA